MDGQTQKLRIPELDGVRGLAMVLVLIWHFFYNQLQTTPGSIPAYAMKFLSFTWAGVDLFFVLSGFLIGGILLRQRSAPRYFQAFYTRRLCRIFPLYYLMLGLFLLGLAGNLGQAGSQYAWLFEEPLPLWSYAFYLQNITAAWFGSHGPNWLGITWSLALEEQFYIVLPLFIRFVPDRMLTNTLLILILTAPILRGTLLSIAPQGGGAGYLLLPGRWDALFLGVLGSVAVQCGAGRSWLQNNLGMVRSATVACFLVAAALLVTSQGIGSWGMSWFGHTVIALMSLGVIFLATTSPESQLGGFLRNPVLGWVGTVSYGVYLIHQPMAGLLHGFFRNQSPRISNAGDALITLLALALTFALASFSWSVFEKPLVRLGQNVRYES